MNLDAPIEMQSPEDAYLVFYILFAVNAVATLIWLAWKARQNRTIVPLAALAGGLVVGAIVPPIYNALTKVWFPDNIPLPFVEAFGMKDPLFDLLGYSLFIGFGGYYLYMQLQNGGGARVIYGTFLMWGLVDLVLEIPFLQWGMYTYFGDQPFLIGGFPLHWVVFNGLVPVLAGVLMYIAVDRWPSGPKGAGWRVAASPVVSGAILMIPIFPIATALHADVPSAVRYVAAIASIAISVWMLQVCARAAEREKERLLALGTVAPTAAPAASAHPVGATASV